MYIGIGGFGLKVPSPTQQGYPSPKLGQRIYSILSFAWEVRGSATLPVHIPLHMHSSVACRHWSCSL